MLLVGGMVVRTADGVLLLLLLLWRPVGHSRIPIVRKTNTARHHSTTPGITIPVQRHSSAVVVLKLPLLLLMLGRSREFLGIVEHSVKFLAFFFELVVPLARNVELFSELFQPETKMIPLALCCGRCRGEFVVLCEEHSVLSLELALLLTLFAARALALELLFEELDFQSNRWIEVGRAQVSVLALVQSEAVVDVTAKLCHVPLLLFQRSLQRGLSLLQRLAFLAKPFRFRLVLAAPSRRRRPKTVQPVIRRCGSCLLQSVAKVRWKLVNVPAADRAAPIEHRWLKPLLKPSFSELSTASERIITPRRQRRS